jgi:16S rRNA (guanine527-N7)-methyltransferase
MLNESAKNSLIQGAKDLGVSLNEHQFNQLDAYLELLLKWNKVFNLTSIRDPEEGVKKHLLDCLGIIPVLEKMQRQGLPMRSLMDVGSGGGLPAVVIAVCFPELKVLSVDAVAKKTTFITQAALELGLKNIKEKFDVVTCRAFSSLKDFVSLTESNIGEPGMWLAMKGRRPDAELQELPSFAEVTEVIDLHIPGLGEERSVVLMRHI